MRRSVILLAGGGGLLVVGLVMLATIGSRIAQDAEDKTFFRAILTFSPLEEKKTDFSITNTTRPFYLVVSSTDDENQIIKTTTPVSGQILDPEGREISSTQDATRGILRVEPTTAGLYSIVLKNQRSDKGTQVLVSATYASIPTTGSDTLTQAPVAVAGTILMMVGALVAIAGAVLFVFEWRRSKNKNTTLKS